MKLRRPEEPKQVGDVRVIDSQVDITATPAEIWEVVEPLELREYGCHPKEFGGLTGVQCFGQIALDLEKVLKARRVNEQYKLPTDKRVMQWRPKTWHMIGEGIAFGIKIGIQIEKNRQAKA